MLYTQGQSLNCLGRRNIIEHWVQKALCYVNCSYCILSSGSFIKTKLNYSFWYVLDYKYLTIGTIEKQMQLPFHLFCMNWFLQDKKRRKNVHMALKTLKNPKTITNIYF